LLYAGQPFVAGIIVAAMLGYLAIAYAPRLKTKGDATSPIAAAATIALAFLAGTGTIGLALAGTAVVVLILAMKDEVASVRRPLDERIFTRWPATRSLRWACCRSCRMSRWAVRRLDAVETVVGGDPRHRLLLRRLCRQPIFGARHGLSPRR
jgi:hypothetical protein